MKVKTKSGFVCNVNENKIKDWLYVRAAANAARATNDANAIADVVFMIHFLLGDEEEARLIEHVTGKDGIADSALMQQEFSEITRLMGEEIKKSNSSQA